jgi:hypothetical protein
MRYDIMVTGCKTGGAKTVVARQLAHDPSIPLQKAIAMVEAGPVILYRNLDLNEVKLYTQQLSKHGISWKTIESVKESHSHESIPPSAPPPPASVPIKEKSEATEGQLPKPHSITHMPGIPVMISELENPSRKADRFDFDENSRKTYLYTFILIALFISFLVAAILIDRSRRSDIKLKKIKAYSSVSSLPAESPSDKKKGNPRTERKQTGKPVPTRNEISPENKAASLSMLDSARLVETDYLKIIYFYKMAISFNRYNLHAWYGLLNAYRNAGMTDEMEKTTREMKEIFGENVFSAARIVEPYGTINDAFLTVDGNYRIEYRTKQTGRAQLLEETYMVVRELRQICGCGSISLFASSGPGSGMIVHMNTSVTVSSIEDYEHGASITFLK